MRILVLLAASAALLLTSGAAQAQTPPAAPQPPPKDRPFSAERRREVPYELSRDRMLFRMTVADREVWALLDTGATGSLIDLQLARKLGLSLEPEVGPSKTVNGGSMPLWRAKDVSFTIPGQFSFNASQFLAADLKANANATDAASRFKNLGPAVDPERSNRDVEFVFGSDFLQNMVLVVAPEKSAFQLFPSGIVKPPPNADALDIRNSATGPTATISVGGRPISVTIDTGANVDLCVLPAVWTSLSPQLMSVNRGVATDAAGVARSVRRGKLQEITIGQTTLKDVAICEAPIPGYPNDGFVGLGLMSRFGFAMDLRQGKLWLLPMADAAKAAAPQTPPRTPPAARPSPG